MATMPDKHPKGSHNPSQKSLQRWDTEGGAPKTTEKASHANFLIEPELYVRGEPNRGIRSLHETRRKIRTLDDAIEYVREHRKGRDLSNREDVIRKLENAKTREQMLDAVNAFRIWLEQEDLLFPTG
jgi:hypothetical protein